MKIVAADVGGTKSIFSLSDADDVFNLLCIVKYKSNDFCDFGSLLKEFYKDAGLETDDEIVLSLALPGVVQQDSAELTNLSWNVDANAIKENFNINKIIFINDFQAAALGVDHVSDKECIVLNAGKLEKNGVCVVVGAGTGLGVAWSVAGDAMSQSFSTEGGHVDFAPVDDEQIKLHEYLINTHGHVSYERLLSGDGLVTIYKFLSAMSEIPSQEMDAAAWINQRAVMADDVIAIRAIEIFCDIYGAFVGNLGLLFKPSKGLYVAGGIAAKILPWMKSARFRNAYLNKGRMSKVLENIQVNLITDERLGLLGAITAATLMQGQ